MTYEWNETMFRVRERKNQLETMNTDCRMWLTLSNELIERLLEIELELTEMPDLIDFTEDARDKQHHQVHIS